MRPRQTPSLVHGLVIAGLLAASQGSLGAQTSARSAGTVDPRLLDGLSYRSLEFSRGGRSTAVSGVPSQPLVYYFGATGGGVWKTTDAGAHWANVSDGFFEAASIGAIAVADSDANVIYAGTGSACPRGNVSPGVGMYRSTDAGQSWTHIGLRDAGQIGRIRVHPTNDALVYAAVLGNLFGPSDDRGVFRSTDGGTTWEKVLFISDTTGVVDLAMDPGNPRILYAGAWAVRRSPWSIDSGSMDGGVYRSRDGGTTWQRLSQGLPSDVMVGRTAVAVSPARPDRVWALVEAGEGAGGVYRSDDGGDRWQRVNDQRMLQQRAWYYTHIYADPSSPDTVYALNTGFYKSTDGGRTYDQIQVPHGDNHDLWINPRDPATMINANDGGVNVSFTGGSAWSTQENQPTAEFYRVTVDSRFPYRVYGAQQDNSTVSVSSVPGGGATSFYSVGGGESGHIAVDPRHPNIVYAGSYGGTITRMDTDTRLSEMVRAYPEAQTGQRAADMAYRFQWNAPIRISPHDPDVVYHASQVVHRTRDAGRSWDVISPDLTRNDKSKQDYSGGAGITRDNTGVEVYGTIFAFEESPHAAGLLWAGTDDGRVQLSKDDGRTWTDVTPTGMPEGVVNAIDLSAHDAGRAHMAVYRYRQNDVTPYIYRTNDYGHSWTRLADGTNGIPSGHFVRVVREDPARRGLLYAGTEFGLYASFDDGAHWQSIQANLPITPVTDLLVHDDDLIIATQGRAFWMLDDLSVLREVNGDTSAADAHLFTPEVIYRSGHLPGSIAYYLPEIPTADVRIEILDSAGGTVAGYRGAPGAVAPGAGGESGAARGPFVPAHAGLNRFEWNARHDRLFEIPRGIVMWGGTSMPPRVVPGTYAVRVTVGDWSATRSLVVESDPRVPTTAADYAAQLAFARRVGDRIKDAYSHLSRLRDAKSQATDLGARLKTAGYGEAAATQASAMTTTLEAIEGELTQRQGEGGQDALNFPGRLDNQFVTLYSDVVNRDSAPTRGALERFDDLAPVLDELLDRLNDTVNREVASFNAIVVGSGAPPLIVSPRSEPESTSRPSGIP